MRHDGVIRTEKRSPGLREDWRVGKDAASIQKDGKQAIDGGSASEMAVLATNAE